jgi:hypothetical protein
MRLSLAVALVMLVHAAAHADVPADVGKAFTAFVADSKLSSARG